MELLDLVPPAVSAYAREYDWLFFGLSTLVTLLVLPVVVLTILFVIRYREGTTVDRRERASKNLWVEASWSAVPFFLTLVFLAWAAKLFIVQQTPPEDGLQISAVAKQWMWKFQHPDGTREINHLHVPMGEKIVLTMTSQDVIHSLFFPALRIKQDVLPGRYTKLWFEADRTGTYHLLCTEYCGLNHARMGGAITIMTPERYGLWLQEQDPGEDLVAEGRALFSRYGCSGCHVDSDVVRAPSLVGLYGSPVPLADGDITLADEAYIHDSIVLPMKHVVAGYRPVMPAYEGKIDEGELFAVVAYIKSLAMGEGEDTP